MSENVDEGLDRKTVTVSLKTVEELLRKYNLVAEEDIAWIMHESVEEIEFDGNKRKVFPASKFRIEYDTDLELDATYAFQDIAIIVLRQKRQEGK